MIGVLAILAYGAMAIVTYGVQFASWQRKFKSIAKSHRTTDMSVCALGSILWPFTLPIHLLIVGWYGILFVPEDYTDEEKYPFLYEEGGHIDRMNKLIKELEESQV